MISAIVDVFFTPADVIDFIVYRMIAQRWVDNRGINVEYASLLLVRHHHENAFVVHWLFTAIDSIDRRAILTVIVVDNKLFDVFITHETLHYLFSC